jgi:hypothetical protein
MSSRSLEYQSTAKGSRRKSGVANPHQKMILLKIGHAFQRLAGVAKWLTINPDKAPHVDRAATRSSRSRISIPRQFCKVGPYLLSDRTSIYISVAYRNERRNVCALHRLTFVRGIPSEIGSSK